MTPASVVYGKLWLWPNATPEGVEAKLILVVLKLAIQTLRNR